MHHRTVDKPTYGTVASLVEEEQPLVATPMETQSARPEHQTVANNHHSSKWGCRKLFCCGVGPCLMLSLITAVVLIGASFTLTPPNNDDDDLHMAEIQALSVVPFWGKRYAMEQAQNIADSYRDTYLPSKLVYHEIYDAYDFNGNSKGLPPEGCEATVIVIRHCDKGNLREHCDYVGFERSVYISTLFGDNGERWPAPSYLYALNPAHRRNPNKHNYREIETVMPLAKKFGLSVDARFSTDTGKDLAENVFKLLKEGAMCGKVAVISWKHSDIPHLARKLGKWSCLTCVLRCTMITNLYRFFPGCGPRQSCPMQYPSYTFDEAWQIKVSIDSLDGFNRGCHFIAYLLRVACRIVCLRDLSQTTQQQATQASPMESVWIDPARRIRSIGIFQANGGLPTGWNALGCPLGEGC